MKYARKQVLVMAVGFVMPAILAGNPEYKLLKAGDVRSFYGISDSYLSLATLPDIKVMILSPVDVRKIRSGQPTEGTILENLIWALTSDYHETRKPATVALPIPNMLAFREAVSRAVSERFDVVVSTVTYPGFGNLDGTGGINPIVTRAVREGQIIWIQSTGEYHGRVANGRVDVTSLQPLQGKKWVPLNGKPCLFFDVNADQLDLEITLSWKDFPSFSTSTSGTKNDLDLYLYRARENRPFEPSDQNLILKSTRRQVVGDVPNGRNDMTNLPLEFVSTEKDKAEKLQIGHYAVGVAYQGGTFEGKSAEFRLTFSTSKKPYRERSGKELEVVKLIGYPADSESLPSPADNPDAITVGRKVMDPNEIDLTSRGTTIYGQTKPEIWLDGAEVSFDNGMTEAGSHVAAAQMGAFVTLLFAKAKEQNVSFPRLKHIRHLNDTTLVPIKPSDKESHFWKMPTSKDFIELMQKYPN